MGQMMVLRKLVGALRVLRKDPEIFARNLSQYINPDAFENRLIDVMHPSAMHVRFAADHDGPIRLNVLDSA